MYIVEPLKSQDRQDFDCGEESLNRYLRDRVTQDIKRKLNRIFIIREDRKNRVIGYYTLASTTIEAAKFPPAHAKHLPQYPIPAALLGKLAVDKTWQNKGIGKHLLANSIRRIQSVEKEIGLHVLVVDPLTDDLAKFYISVGFVQFLPEKRLFLFMNSLKDRAID
jgi:GNAT superfamily N-acetyltransferase